MDRQVILLNGPSSSGKSTLAKALQALIREKRNEQYTIISIDDFMKVGTDETIYEDDVFEVSGEICEKILEALKTAPGVIVDHVITSERILRQFRTMCGSFLLYTVRVCCPLEVLQKREKERGDRCPGSAESSLTYLYPKDGYDLTVDTQILTAEECSEKICENLFSRSFCREEKTVYAEENLKQIFASDRIRFVEVSELLVKDYLKMVNDNEHVNRYLGGYIGGSRDPYTEEQEVEWVRKALAEKKLVFSMIEKKSGDFIGNIEFMDPREGSAELGIALTAEKQERGYGTEAVSALVRFGWDHLDLHRVFLRTNPENARAIHVYTKCGFREYDRTNAHVYMEIRRH